MEGRKGPGQERSSLWKRYLLSAGAGLAVGLDAGCFPEGGPEAQKIEIVEEKEQQKRSLDGDWEFQSTAYAPVMVDAESYPNFYKFIDYKLSEFDWFNELPEQDQEAYRNGYIGITRRLNPTVNIDNWKDLGGTTISFPIGVEVKPRFQQALDKSTNGGYTRLQQLAEADGYPVLDASQQQALYERAMKNTIPIPESSFYFRDTEGSEDSPARLEKDATERFEALARDFAAMRFGGMTGILPCYTDVLRNGAAQEQRNGLKTSTHTTGRSFDLADSRFKLANGTVITWSEFRDGKAVGPSQYATLIENELRPALTQLALKHGFVPFKERGHLHLYAPKVRSIDLSDLIVSPEEIAEAQVAAKGAAAAPAIELGGSPLLRPEIHADIMRTMERELRTPERSSAAFTRAQALGPLIEETYNIGRTKEKSIDLQRPYVTALQFRPLTKRDAKFASMTPEQVRAALATELQGNDTQRKEAKRILEGSLRAELLRTIRSMSPNDIIRLRLFSGMTVDDPKRAPLHDLEGVWDWKIENKGKKPEVKRYGATARDRLRGKERSVDAVTWLQKQQVACDTFGMYAGELEYDPALVRYITPEVMLAVIHAEFFSELDAQAFIQLTPALFETYNIIYGPAMNDHHFSAGLVQMTAPSFDTMLERKADPRKVKNPDGSLRTEPGPLTKLKTAHPELPFILPAKEDGGYNREQFVDAMVANAESQLFYNAMGVAEHLEAGFTTLQNDAEFRRVWAKATEAERTRFIGTYAPLAINGGRGHANTVANRLLKEKLTSLAAMTERLADISKAIAPKKYGWRGAERGLQTMSYLIAGGTPESQLVTDR